MVAGVLVSSGCGVETQRAAGSEPVPVQEFVVGGYEGWWNATPVSGDTTGLPDETVAVRTDTGDIVDATAREASGQAVGVNPLDVDYTVTPDPTWPEQSIVIIDTATGEVIESFPVDAAGHPTG